MPRIRVVVLSLAALLGCARRREPIVAEPVDATAETEAVADEKGSEPIPDEIFGRHDDEPCPLGDRASVRAKVSAEIVELGVGLVQNDYGMTVLSGGFTVRLENWTDEPVCLQHLGLFSMQWRDRRTGRLVHIVHLCDCILFLQRTEASRVRLGPREVRHGALDSYHWSCTGEYLPPGDYDVWFAFPPDGTPLPGRPIVPETLGRFDDMRAECHRRLEHPSTWKDAVVTPIQQVHLEEPPAATESD
jgi:hypothetical protein